MTALDYSIIVFYFAAVIGLGFLYQRRASKSLDSYFLGGKSLHWLSLAMSGSVSNFDITGTMWIISILYLLGMKSMWHHWMWGFLMGAFFMAYMGKWVRRSNVMTAAEWMRTRFGSGPGGVLARTTSAVMAVIITAGFIGYAFQGIGKFAAVYVPLENLAAATSAPWLQDLLLNHEPALLAVTVISATTLYVLLGGLYSVVITDVIQTVILTIGAIFIACIAWSRLTPEALAAVPEGWTSLEVPWKIEEFAGTENARFHFFGAMVIVWVAKGLLLNLGGPAQSYDAQRFLAARNSRDAAKIGAAWSLFLIVRWAMCAGIALLAITGLTGVTDSEEVMPIVLLEYLPDGIRGLVIAGLLAAFMSTFSSTVNSGASFIIRDIWQPYFGRGASEHKAVAFSYIATVLVVLVGIAIGFMAGSIAQIWDWMMMALTAGVLLPNVLRWYWWRMNGIGYAVGAFAGIVLSMLTLFCPEIPSFYIFPLICLASLIGTIAASLATAPVDKQTLVTFYESVRPFGLWTPVRRLAAPPAGRSKSESPCLTALNVALAMIAILALYLAPMYLVGRFYKPALIWLTLAAATVTILKFTWYDNLPAPEQPSQT